MCRYHTGSLAFGSLILAIIQIIRVLLEYVDHKLKGKRTDFTAIFTGITQLSRTLDSDWANAHQDFAAILF